MATDTSQSESRPESPDYPEGPITCCLYGISKDVHILKTRSWTASLLISQITMLLALVFYLVAFGTTGWVRVVKIDQHPHRIDMVGLWRECIADQCSYISGDVTGPGFKVSQVFAALCLLLIAVGCIVTLRYSLGSLTDMKRVGKTAVFMRFFSFFFLLLLMPVFATTWYQGHARYDKSFYEGDLDYSFKLIAVTFVMEAIGAFFMYCEVLVIQPRRVKPLIKERNIQYYDGITNEGFTELNDSGIYPGDMNLGPSGHRQERLEEQVRGRLNARAAYENFVADPRSEMQVSGAGVAGVAGPLATSGLMGKSTEEINQRFMGITLAEPQYVSANNHNSTLGHEPSAPPITQNRSYLDLDTTRDSIHMPQSVSMQNMYNENLSVMKVYPEDAALQRVTSVSMYNLSGDQAEKPYEYEGMVRQPGERDDFSMQSWHPERTAQVGYHDSHTTPATSYKDRDDQSQYSVPRYDPMVESQDMAQTTDMNKVPPKGRRRERSEDPQRQIKQKSVSPEQDTTMVTREPRQPQTRLSDDDPPDYWSVASQGQFRKQPTPSHDTPAPAERRKARKSKANKTRAKPHHDQNHVYQDKSNLSHAQSNLSLASGATSIVGGCAETEI